MGDDRRAERSKKRLTCTLVIEGNRLSGIVLDISATGLFVQTSANPSPGAVLDLEIEIPGEPQRSVLVVRVARKKIAPPRLKSIVQGGLGLHIQNAPEAYFRFVAQLQAGEAPAASPAKPSSTVKAPPAKKSPARRSAPRRPILEQERFRVRVSQIDGSRSRSLEVSAVSEQAARRQAMATSGEGWKILSCERVA